jgi:nickel transport protein
MASKISCLKQSINSYRILAALLPLLLVGLIVSGTAVAAHELGHRLTESEAVTVQFHFQGEDGPFFEPYEIFSPGSETPFQVGRVNARGEVTFRPEQEGEYRLRVVTEDGHGATVRIEVDAAGEVLWREGYNIGRLGRILAGLGYLFGLFGLLAIWRVRANRPRNAKRRKL